MPGELAPPNSAFGEWIEGLDLPELVGDFADLAEYAPYVRSAVGAYKWFRLQRFKHFLNSLGKSVEALPDAKKNQFRAIITSEAGGEILSEFVDSVLRTSSQTAISALALLYADAGGERYSASFRLSACIALEGLSDQEVDAFVALCNPELAITAKNPPYPVVIASDGLLPKLPPSVQALLSPPQARVAIINALMRRGMFLPDFAAGRLGDGGVGVGFGLSETSYQYRDLLIRARSLLPSTSSVAA